MAQANYPTDKARALQHALYVAAKQSHTRRFHALYDRIAQPHILREAWQRVKRNRGATGIDGETIQAIVGLGEEQMLVELRDLLVEGRYRPHVKTHENVSGKRTGMSVETSTRMSVA
jgi:retron-type reverse transcriptase